MAAVVRSLLAGAICAGLLAVSAAPAAAWDDAGYWAFADRVQSRLDEWWSRIEGWRAKHPLRYEDSSDNEIKPQFMIQALWQATGGEAIITSDVGQHQMWAAQYYDFPQPRRWIN